MVGGDAGLDIHFLSLKTEAERALREEYSITTGERETYEEEVTLEIAPHTRSEILFSWKEIRQQGIIKLTAGSYEARIPFEIVVGLTFDQRQVDISSDRRQPPTSPGDDVKE